MKIFHLPDLGEGLPEAEVVQWHVKEGQTLQTDENMVSVETAKAIVDIPSPQTGQVVKLFANAGDIVQTGAPLMAFGDAADVEPKQQTSASSPVAANPALTSQETAPLNQAPSPNEDAGTVVGKIPENAENLETFFQQSEPTHTHTNPVVPAARHLAQANGLQLDRLLQSGQIKGTGPNGVISLEDVQQYLNKAPTSSPQIEEKTSLPAISEHSGACRTMTLKGSRRAMAHAMTKAHNEVVKVTIEDDADIERWRETEDATLRLIRAICYATSVEPGLNAWYDHDTLSVTQFDDVNLGIAVDTPEGLFVPVISSVDSKRPKAIRWELNELREQLKNRTLPREKLSGATITLSNFGTIAGRYASPVVSPPQVAIIGAGRSRQAAVAHKGKVKVRKILPISLSFDHRVLTGGEAARFLRALILDLQSKE